MLVDIALMVSVFAFAAMVLYGHVLVLSALLAPPADAARAARQAEPAAKPSKLRFRLTAG